MATEINSGAPQTGSSPQPVTKTPRDRSPAFPFISLKTAVDRLAALDTTFGRHPTPATKAGLAWKMKEKSSQAFQTLAALKSYGLIKYQGASEDRVAMLTDDGRNYLRAQQAETKAAILKTCALRPKAMSTYWRRWGPDRPIDAVCLDQLVLKDEFTQSAAQTFLRVYDETVAFAKLANDDKVAPNGEGDDGDDDLDPPPQKPKAGEFVRWETSGGTLMFDARRVLGLSSDGEFVFVDGSPTGLPVQEVTVVPAPPMSGKPEVPTPPANPFAQDRKGAVDQPPPQGMEGDVFTFPGSNSHAVFQWPTGMTPDEFQDLDDWLQIKLRGIKRRLPQQ